MAFHNNTNDEDITITNNNDVFPFNNISGGLSVGIDDTLADMYDDCPSLNFEPSTFTDNKGYFITGKAGPDYNF